MASDSTPKLPLCPWVLGQISKNAPNSDLDVTEGQLKRILHDTIYCLREIGEERARRERQAANNRVRTAQVELSNFAL
jgi:hypothetical protein